jgi:hypothetical protein
LKEGGVREGKKGKKEDRRGGDGTREREGVDEER